MKAAAPGQGIRTPEPRADRNIPEMPIENLHPEYPTDAQIEQMWAAFESHGREGILAFLRKRTLEWRDAERNAEASRPVAAQASAPDNNHNRR